MKIPQEVKNVVETLRQAGYESYIVGGCVRDCLRGVKPKDWDVATNAPPEETEKLFPRVFTVEEFGLVTVLTDSDEANLKEIEIMPYRVEKGYSDKRHPDKLKWVSSIEEDLARRDFTINAVAVKLCDAKREVVDPYGGKKDLKKKIVRAVGDPEERFEEDALRMMRGIRFAVTLGAGWKIEPETRKAIEKNASGLEQISKERIRDEFVKIIMSPRAAEGVDLLRTTGLLRLFLPELEAGVGVAQNKHHTYTCYVHNLKALGYAARKGYNKYVRLAALLHDVAKPMVKEGEGDEATFYNHEVVGEEMTREILKRLRFPKKEVERVANLVRWHLFYYNVGEVSASSVRKLVRNVGLENMDDLLKVRYADRIGSGCPKACPYKLRHLQYMVEKVSRDPVSVESLKVGGEEVMDILGIDPGPEVGWALDILLGEVLGNPEKNNKKFLNKKLKELKKLSEKDFKVRAEKSKEEIEKVEQKKDDMLKKKYWVK